MILTLFFNKKYRILTLYININSQKKKKEKKPGHQHGGNWDHQIPFPPPPLSNWAYGESTGATDNLPDICSVQRAKKGGLLYKIHVMQQHEQHEQHLKG
jgi:hypothetical protein